MTVVPPELVSSPQAASLTRDSLSLDDIHKSKDNDPFFEKSVEIDDLPPLKLLPMLTLAAGQDEVMLRKSNKDCQLQSQLVQTGTTTFWSTHRGDLFYIPKDTPPIILHPNNMWPSGLSCFHPASQLLKEWSQYGCPTKNWRPWSTAEMEAAILCGACKSALRPNVIKHFADKDQEKVWNN